VFGVPLAATQPGERKSIGSTAGKAIALTTVPKINPAKTNEQ